MTRDIIETIEYKGMNINVYPDDYTQSPEEWGNEDVCFWNREITVENKYINRNIFGAYIKHEDFDEYKDEVKEVAKKYWIFGIDALIHSGIWLSMHNEGMRCKWDTSDYVGCIIVAKSEARLQKKAEKIARGILETWNDYLQGNVYSYTCEDTVTGNFFGGCSGFYGDYTKSGLIEYAHDDIETYIDNEMRKSRNDKIKELRQQADDIEKTI
jgi:hypothetical protein